MLFFCFNIPLIFFFVHVTPTKSKHKTKTKQQRDSQKKKTPHILFAETILQKQNSSWIVKQKKTLHFYQPSKKKHIQKKKI